MRLTPVATGVAESCVTNCGQIMRSGPVLRFDMRSVTVADDSAAVNDEILARHEGTGTRREHDCNPSYLGWLTGPT